MKFPLLLKAIRSRPEPSGRRLEPSRQCRHRP